MNPEAVISWNGPDWLQNTAIPHSDFCSSDPNNCLSLVGCKLTWEHAPSSCWQSWHSPWEEKILLAWWSGSMDQWQNYPSKRLLSKQCKGKEKSELGTAVLVLSGFLLFVRSFVMDWSSPVNEKRYKIVDLFASRQRQAGWRIPVCVSVSVASNKGINNCALHMCYLGAVCNCIKDEIIATYFQHGKTLHSVVALCIQNITWSALALQNWKHRFLCLGWIQTSVGMPQAYLMLTKISFPEWMQNGVCLVKMNSNCGRSNWHHCNHIQIQRQILFSDQTFAITQQCENFHHITKVTQQAKQYA